MSNRTAVIHFGYSHKVHVPATLALKIAEMLDNLPVVADVYGDGGLTWYETGDVFITNIELLGPDADIQSAEAYTTRMEEREAALLGKE